MATTRRHMEVVDRYYLKYAGYLKGSHTKCAVLMDDSSQHQIVRLFKMNLNERNSVLSFSALDVSGKEHFAAINRSSGGDKFEKFVVTAAGVQIGEMEVATSQSDERTNVGQADGYTILETGSTKFKGRTRLDKRQTWYEFKDMHGTDTCCTYNKHRGILEIQLGQKFEQNQKCLHLFACAFFFHWNFKYDRMLPNTNISILRRDLSVNINQMNARDTTSTLINLYRSKQMFIRVVGHNSLKNIVYYDVYDNSTDDTNATIEVTPEKDYQGYAQMVIKDSYGAILCTAIHFPLQEITALYDSQKGLFAYRLKQVIYDTRFRPYLELARPKTNLRQTQGRQCIRSLNAFIHPLTSYEYAEQVDERSGAIKIINSMRKKWLTPDQLLGILVFSIQREMSMVSVEKPTPEIEHFYINSKPAMRTYIS